MIRNFQDAAVKDRVDEDHGRRIGPVGIGGRVLVGAGLVVVGLLHGHPWGVAWYEVVLGLVVFPALVISAALVGRRHTSGPLRLTGSRATTLNCVAIVALSINPITGAAIDLFYGVTLLTSAWRRQPGCEVTVLSNWILRRDDEIGCPIFSPIDRFENRDRTRRSNLTATGAPPNA